MDNEYQKYLSGEYSNQIDRVVADMIAQNKRLLVKFNSTDISSSAERTALMQQMFGAVGENVHIDVDFHSECGKHIFIGNNVVINMNCTFLDDNYIKIGNNVLIAPNVQLYTATHPINQNERLVKNWDKASGNLFFNTKALPITIEDNVWIGGGAIILPGITIGQNSVIGAGSVVTKSIPANCLAVGNPCKVVKSI